MLTEREIQRYRRQIIIWGEEVQRRLKVATIAVVGIGGLGSPAATYLAVAGFGRIVIIDSDRVDLTNLNRQVLHWEEDIGVMKTESAASKLRRLNPDVEISPLQGRITADNVDSLLQGVDGIVDALDNVESRYLINEYAVRTGVPLFHGAVEGFEGRVSTIIPGKTPCLRCIMPSIPPPKIIPVIGATPAVIASLQVTEAIKYFTGIGDLLLGEMLVYDGLSMDFRRIRLPRLKDCPACGGVR